MAPRSRLELGQSVTEFALILPVLLTVVRSRTIAERHGDAAAPSSTEGFNEVQAGATSEVGTGRGIVGFRSRSAGRSSGRWSGRIATATDSAATHITGKAMAEAIGTVQTRLVLAPQATSAAASGRRSQIGLGKGPR